jgi:hypothetical protein
MSSIGAASLAALSPARAAASRKNGAKSRGPKTLVGKARSAQNALKHGLRAQKYVVLPEEDAAAFRVLEAALLEELAPEGALQRLLAQRVVAAAWRLERAEQIEAELFARNINDPFGKGDLGLALIRDCNGAGAFGTLLRYRGTTLAEFWRALRTLKALQAETAARPKAAPRLQPGQPEVPIEPEAGANPRETASRPTAGKTAAAATGAGRPSAAHSATIPPAGASRGAWHELPIEPEARANPRPTRPPATGRALAGAR